MEQTTAMHFNDVIYNFSDENKLHNLNFVLDWVSINNNLEMAEKIVNSKSFVGAYISVERDNITTGKSMGPMSYLMKKNAWSYIYLLLKE